jgi:hypothetical protein
MLLRVSFLVAFLGLFCVFQPFRHGTSEKCAYQKTSDHLSSQTDYVSTLPEKVKPEFVNLWVATEILVAKIFGVSLETIISMMFL